MTLREIEIFAGIQFEKIEIPFRKNKGLHPFYYFHKTVDGKHGLMKDSKLDIIIDEYSGSFEFSVEITGPKSKNRRIWFSTIVEASREEAEKEFCAWLNDIGIFLEDFMFDIADLRDECYNQLPDLKHL